MSFHIPALPLTEAGWLFAALFALILIVPVMAERTRVPVVIGFVLAGMLVGPGVSGLLTRDGGIELLGSAGLLYLMFIAGLELNLDEFIQHRRASLVFGVASFVVPMVLGFGGMVALGSGVLAAVLLASCWASHTLVAYPEFQRQGTSGNRAVSVTVGATILTDTAALLVLAVVAGVHRGDIGPAFWLTLLPSIAALLVIALWLLPALARRFFSGLGQETGVRFVFVVFVVFAFSGLAELAGIEGIVGAFLAGLSLNRLVPQGSPLMQRLEFFGNQFMIPLFLLSVGLLIDPAVMLERSALILGAGFAVVAIVSKFVAAAGTGRWFGYDRDEIGSMFALSSAQAAATLAAILVGVQIGLIDERTLNAVIGVIAVTCLLSSWLAGRYAARLPHPAPKRAVGATVIVPVVRPESAGPLMRIAAAMARPDAGAVVALTVANIDTSRSKLEQMGAATETAASMARSNGVEADVVVRIDASPDKGIQHTVTEHDGSLMIVGWKGTSRSAPWFGGILDEIVAHSRVPTIIARLTDEPIERLILAVPSAAGTGPSRSSLVVGAHAVRRLQADRAVPVMVIAEPHSEDLASLAEETLGAPFREVSSLVVALRDIHRPGDLVVLPVEPGRERVPALGARVARSLPDASLLIVSDRSARSLTELTTERVAAEHPFGPPPWVRTG